LVVAQFAARVQLLQVSVRGGEDARIDPAVRRWKYFSWTNRRSLPGPTAAPPHSSAAQVRSGFPSGHLENRLPNSAQRQRATTCQCPVESDTRAAVWCTCSGAATASHTFTSGKRNEVINLVVCQVDPAAYWPYQRRRKRQPPLGQWGFILRHQALDGAVYKPNSANQVERATSSPHPSLRNLQVFRQVTTSVG
jgi:hypothetical protein